MTALADECDLVRDVRVLGLMIGIELSIDGTPVVQGCMDRKLLINCTHGTVIRLLPAMNLTDEQAHEGCDILAEVIKNRPQPALSVPELTRAALAATLLCENLLLTLADLKAAEIDRIFAITEDLKAKYQQGLREALLPGRVMALLFEKPSLRTRVSFEAGMINLGGSSLFLGDDVGFGSRESVADFGRVLSEYVDVIVVRAYHHQTARRAGPILQLLGHQRPDRLRPSLPGAGRLVHAQGAGRPAEGTNAGLRRRRQQRGPQSGRGLRQDWAWVRHGHARRLSVRRRVPGRT